MKRDWGGGLRKRDWSESEASNTKTCYGKHLQIVWHRNTSLVSNLDIGQWSVTSLCVRSCRPNDHTVYQGEALSMVLNPWTTAFKPPHLTYLILSTAYVWKYSCRTFSKIQQNLRISPVFKKDPAVSTSRTRTDLSYCWLPVRLAVNRTEAIVGGHYVVHVSIAIHCPLDNVLLQKLHAHQCLPFTGNFPANPQPKLLLFPSFPTNSENVEFFRDRISIRRWNSGILE